MKLREKKIKRGWEENEESEEKKERGGSRGRE